MALKNWNIDTTLGNSLNSMRNWGNYDNTLISPEQLSMTNNVMDLGSLGSVGLSPSNNSSWMGNLFGGFLDKTDMNTGMKTQGWGMPAIGAASGLMNGFLGMKQYGLAKEQLKQSKKEWNMNWGAQQKMVNSQLEDRQRARVASNSTGYQSVGDYMKEKGI